MKASTVSILTLTCTSTTTHHSVSHAMSQPIKGSNSNSAQHHHFNFIFLQLPATYGQKMIMNRVGGLSDAPHIPAGFRSFQWIPVPFQWNLPAKISLLPRNFDIPVISPEQSPELTGMEWHWNPVTGMNTKNCQIW